MVHLAHIEAQLGPSEQIEGLSVPRYHMLHLSQGHHGQCVVSGRVEVELNTQVRLGIYKGEERKK